ncbi:hypothetical protein [Paenibacillus arenosi]|uniref:Uncharacterized protein n=1 Tax=Paenibacillus arenosi TaxID=2774142 RepID=A0ABR9AWE0_9BACL|nr:hypothetical protein [Paenibacillus arenosi]MBD8497271.1 hypothetical protein [Paenibacillus arenosi]
MLELTSPVWSELDGPYGSAENVPQLIEQLQMEYVEDVKDELYYEQLFHQNTIYSCTLAAVPYLAEIARQSQSLEIKLDIYVTCGLFEFYRSESEGTSNELPTELQPFIDGIGLGVCTDIYKSYLSAIADLAEYSSDMIRYAAEVGKDNSEKRYIIAAEVAYRGWKGAAGVLTTFNGGDEYVASCLSCGEDIYIWPTAEDDNLLVYRNDPVFYPEQESISIIPAEDITNNELAVLEQLSISIDESRLMRHIPYLAGHTSCPSCHASCHIWTSLTNMYKS